MKLIIGLSSFVFIAFLSATGTAAIIETRVEYKDGEQLLEGWFMKDNAARKSPILPGIVVVHEWMGIVQHTKDMARKLAGLGYAVFVADIYGKGIRPTNTDEAKFQSTKFRSDRPLLRKRVQLALDTLKAQKNVDASKLGAIGYCFGGTTVLELARSGADIKGVVSVHGGLNTPKPEDAKNIKARVLVLHGGDDPNVPDDEVQAFLGEMRSAKVDWQLVSYGGAVHAFTNPKAGADPSKGAAYDEKADKRSWEDTKDFFKETL